MLRLICAAFGHLALIDVAWWLWILHWWEHENELRSAGGSFWLFTVPWMYPEMSRGRLFLCCLALRGVGYLPCENGYTLRKVKPSTFLTQCKKTQCRPQQRVFVRRPWIMPSSASETWTRKGGGDFGIHRGSCQHVWGCLHFITDLFIHHYRMLCFALVTLLSRVTAQPVSNFWNFKSSVPCLASTLPIHEGVL